MERLIFLVLYAIAIFSKMQANLYNPYFENDYIYVGYIVILLIWNILFLFCKRGKIRHTNALIIILIMYSYIMTFGFIFNNELLKIEILDNTFKMLMMVTFIWETACLIVKYRCFISFLRVTYWTQVIYLLSALIFNFEGLEFLAHIGSILDSTGRYRVGYGSHANITGIFIFFTFCVSFLISEYSDKRQKRNMKIVNGILWVMLISTASRNSLMCTAVLYGSVLLSNLYKKNKDRFVKYVRKGILIAGFASIFIFAFAGRFRDLLMSLNRFWPIYNNLQVWINSGRIVFGIGYVDPAYYAGMNIIYGSKTTYLENFYVATIVSTGVLGFLWIVLMYYKIIKSILQSTIMFSPELRVKIISVVASFMLIGMGESYGFTHGLETSFVFFIICIYLASYKDTRKEKGDIECCKDNVIINGGNCDGT